MLSVKQDSIKYHFLSLWYDVTWDWTQVSWTIGEHSTHNWEGVDKEVHTFPKGINLKVNITQLEFELAYFKVTVQQFSHYVTRLLPLKKKVTLTLNKPKRVDIQNPSTNLKKKKEKFLKVTKTTGEKIISQKFLNKRN